MHGRIAALVIEDMDIDITDGSARWSRYFNVPDLEARRQVGRSFDSFSALSKSLSQWYDKVRIDGWRHDGRVFERQDGSWWSGISPLTRVFCLLSTHTHTHTRK